MSELRLCMRFSRIGMTKYVSHLDMQRAFARVLRRTKLPVKYSQGFNPHIIISFAQALAVGLETRGDYMEFSLTEPADLSDVEKRIKAQMPPGLDALQIFSLPVEQKKLMALVRAAEYTVRVEKEELLERLKQALEGESLFITDKKGNRVDVRPLILKADCLEGRAMLTLSLREGASLSPFALMREIAPESEFEILREDLLFETEGVLCSLSKLAGCS